MRRLLDLLAAHERIALVFALATAGLFAARGLATNYLVVGEAYASYLWFVTRAVLALWAPLFLWRRWRGRAAWRDAVGELAAYLRGALAVLVVTVAYTHLKARRLDFNPHLLDRFLLAIDDRLFAAGGDFVSWVARHNDDRAWTGWLEQIYAKSGMALGLPLGVAFGWRGREPVRRTLAALVLLYALGALLYIAVPSLGPAFVRHGAYVDLEWTGTAAMQASMFRWLRAMAASPGATVVPFHGIAAFPSLHVGVAWLGVLVAWRYVRWVALVAAAGTLAIAVAAVWFGWHYVIDFPAGLGLAAFCWWAAGRMEPQPPAAEPVSAPDSARGAIS